MGGGGVLFFLFACLFVLFSFFVNFLLKLQLSLYGVQYMSLITSGL